MLVSVPIWSNGFVQELMTSFYVASGHSCLPCAPSFNVKVHEGLNTTLIVDAFETSGR